MTLRRGAHRGVAGTKSLSFFEGAVKPSLNPQGVGKSRPQRFSRQSAAGGVKEFAGLARGKIKAGTNASYVTPQMKSARVVPRSDNENLAPSGSAHIIVAHSMDKQLPPSAPRSFGGDAGSC
jgi:hypothetical protein